MDVYPLIFTPIFKPKPWGGRRLADLFGKPLPPEVNIGESWEVADLADDRSVVANGPARGRTIDRMIQDWGEALTGRAKLREGRFPLLIKFLEARGPLSVQVHPDESSARRLGGSATPKNEAWYIVEADEDAAIYRGLRSGVDVAALREAVGADRVEEVLHRIPVRKGHCYYLPGGTVHALGGGVVVAEVQTSSDTTFRLYDWGRTDPDANAPRALHVEEALACVSTDSPPAAAEQRHHVASVWTSVTHLIRCDAFLMDRVRMVAGVSQPIPHQEMVLWIVLEGSGSIRWKGDGEPVRFAAGQTVLLPAGLKEGAVETEDNAMWLEVSIPITSPLAELPRPDRAALGELGHGGRGFVPLNVSGDDSR